MTKKLLAGAAMASLMLPFMASAHGSASVTAQAGLKQDEGLHIGQVLGGHGGLGLALGLQASSTVRHDDGDKGGDNDRDGRGHATSTAVNITNKANRLNAAADFFGSIEPALAARIASSSLDASITAAANTSLGGFNTAVANAKVQTSAALSVAATIGSTTASSTIAAQARADLRSAKSFLMTARQDLLTIIRLIFGK